MRNVAVVGFAQRQMLEFDGSPTMVELLVPLFAELYEQTGFTRKDIGFWCSGSSDYLAGRSFSFVSAVDAIGALPPVNESHVEMDAAWALYEAWVKIQTGEIDTALVYGFGKSSAGVLRRTLALQLDPYTMTPLWPDSVSLAGLQARLGIEAELWDETAMASVAQRSLTDAETNPHAVRRGGSSVEELLARPMYADPLRKHDCAPVTDGASAIVLAADDRARDAAERPAWITGLAHNVDPLQLGARDLTASKSATRAAESAVIDDVEVAELHAPFSHQELILRHALGLASDVRINPSGGALTSNPMFTAGLNRIGEAADRIRNGEVTRALGHATSGPLLQQNLVCVMDGATK
ncbi:MULTISPECIES: thiolase domain-containing protein [unclassified Nocardioides]|uniref:thiolase domain-containing protein n=1 Tax=unclassified Nocardioides TaxID=2615069 RepID=UPI0006F3EA00|nr:MULTISPECIES: thiolase domain-containing protein [unclassified Nocardioides]KQY64321.1 lipid-transfer protein [Nocardioides sp. Root140]KQZ70240.1 lipid-transfer protein [Nocardioides sp. Root151]KRF16337.1 lipid-transfer protein [Nocardioides sp. Soil796]